MADLVLETGSGLTTSNTYCSVDEADTYHENKLYVTDWTGATEDTKERALVWATRLLDEYVNWHGLQVKTNQALGWPRSSVFDKEGNTVASNTVPTFLKNATAEFARNLIAEDRTLETNRDLTGFKEMRIDVIELKVDTFKKKDTMPPSVWSIIAPYCSKASTQRSLERM